MTLFDKTLPTPAGNLAADELLLDMAESGLTGEVLRFWESQEYFVVLGSSNRLADEVNEERCLREGIPILRRHSGGGTVLQGPGCLNYALVLMIHPDSPTRNITETTNFVMQRNAEALSALLGLEVALQGSSDLTIAGRKFSGNAQRRKLKALLFHGTLLVDFDLAMVERYLKMPAKQPAYRNQRSHTDFLTNIAVARNAVREALARQWNALPQPYSLPPQRLQALAAEKYSSDSWTRRF